jgi:hypothetical protein
MTVTVSVRTSKVTPLASLRRHVVLSVVLVLLFMGAALAWVVSQTRTYTAEARLAVAGTSLSAQAVPGFALASQELASDYARYVNNSEEQSALEKNLGVPDGSVEDVVASSIPESNVIRIEVSSASEQTAVDAADRIAQSLIDQVNNRDTSQREADEALARYTELSGQVAEAEQAALAAQNALDNALGRAESGFPARGDNIDGLRAAAATTSAQLSVLQVQQEALGQRYQQLLSAVGTAANLTPIQSARSTGNDLIARAQRYGLLGLAAGLVLSLAVANRIENRQGRRPSQAAPDDVLRREGQQLQEPLALTDSTAGPGGSKR